MLSLRRGVRKIIVDWGRLGGPIEPVPGSHLFFFGLRPPSSVVGGDYETDSHWVGHCMTGAAWETRSRQSPGSHFKSSAYVHRRPSWRADQETISHRVGVWIPSGWAPIEIEGCCRRRPSTANNRPLAQTKMAPEAATVDANYSCLCFLYETYDK